MLSDVSGKQVLGNVALSITDGLRAAGNFPDTDRGLISNSPATGFPKYGMGITLRNVTVIEIRLLIRFLFYSEWQRIGAFLTIND